MELLLTVAIVIILIVTHLLNKSKQDELKAQLQINDALSQRIHELNETTANMSSEIDRLSLSLSLSTQKAEEDAARYVDIWKKEETVKIRKEAVDKSRSILRGQVVEHLAPFLIDGLSPGDFRWIGSPIDFLVIDGCGAVNDGKADEISRVILMDIKSGKSQLSKIQRRIRDAVKAGRVEFMTINLENENV